jgi:hypothetical protein
MIRRYALWGFGGLAGIFVLALILVKCGLIPLCSNTEIERAMSPDGKWLAVVSIRMCNSTFVGPFKSVTLRRTMGGQTETESQKVVELEMGQYEDYLSVRWAELSVLEVTVSNAIKYFIKREDGYRGVRIKYNILPVRP